MIAFGPGTRLAPIPPTEIAFEGKISGRPAEKFATEADRRKVSPAELAASLLVTIIKDDLYGAILDE